LWVVILLALPNALFEALVNVPPIAGRRLNRQRSAERPCYRASTPDALFSRTHRGTEGVTSPVFLGVRVEEFRATIGLAELRQRSNPPQTLLISRSGRLALWYQPIRIVLAATLTIVITATWSRMLRRHEHANHHRRNTP
jgi:hypothetical protein